MSVEYFEVKNGVMADDESWSAVRTDETLMKDGWYWISDQVGDSDNGQGPYATRCEAIIGFCDFGTEIIRAALTPE